MHQLMTKKQIREWVRCQRQAIDISQIDAVSRQITAQIVALKVFEEASILFLYAAFEKEIQTCYLAERALREGKQVAYPKVDVHTGEMHFYSVKEINELERNNYGSMTIQEPNPEKHIRVIPGEKDLMILPGVAFDHHFNRIGYGGGFYDRYLTTYQGGYKIGVCMGFQLLETLPVEAFDIKMDGLVWESGKQTHLPFNRE